jgi:uncharacterized protein YjdB
MTPLRSSRAPRTRVALMIALFACLTSCGGGGEPTGSNGGGDGASVATVVITGMPGTTMLVGDSVHLVATAVNASGGVVSNQTISWTSSAPAVAAVASNGVLRALGAGKSTITASAAGHDGGASVEVVFGVTLGTPGGTFSAANGAFSLAVPAGSLPQATLLTVRPAASAPADVRVVPNTAFELGPDGVNFFSATLTMTYDAARLPSGLFDQSLQLYMQSGSAWTVVPGSKVNTTAHTASGVIRRSGIYAVRSTAVDKIVLTGAAVNGALYVGQGGQIAAGLFASTNDSLPARPITWTSSAPSAVAVDATGKVTAMGSGTATITATTDGKSASTVVTSLARPTANWSRATDWSTFQGNAQHSAFVDATIDPGSFVERWVTTPIANGGYYQPTTGGGRLYLSTSFYFGGQKVLALNPTNGAQLWARDFGEIYGINQVTYDGGFVYLTSGGHEDTYLWSLNAADGTLKYQTAFDSQWEHWMAPVISGSTIVTAGGYYGGMYGFDRASGTKLFFNSGTQTDNWGPAAWGGLVYITDGGVKGITPTDGKVATQISDSRVQGVTTPVIGGNNDLLTITGNRLVSVDLPGKKVAWEQSGTYTGMPVVGGNVVYGFSGTVVAARNEADGSLLWSWTPPAPYTQMQSMVLTNNVLFVSTSSGYSPGATFAIDLASHLTVWSYPMSGSMALSSQGVLYIVQGAKVAAISVR